MALNNSYDEQAVIQAIAAALETFYDTLIEKVDTLNIQKVMRRKNPYLYRAKAMKSGPAVFNADSKKRQEQNFVQASKLAQQAKARYEAYIGYCYGKKAESGRGKPRIYQELAGKKFWTELTGDEEFYTKIITYMGDMPEKYVADYKESYNKAFNRLVREFSNDFCKEDGGIDWEKLVEFNSGD